MPDTFDEQEYKRKLIAGGLPPNDAAELAARTAAARRESCDLRAMARLVIKIGRSLDTADSMAAVVLFIPFSCI